MTFSSKEMQEKIRTIRARRYHPFQGALDLQLYQKKLFETFFKETNIMPAETLLTASRRAVRDFNICLNKGGLIDEDLQRTMHTLDKMVRMEADRQKHDVEAADAQMLLFDKPEDA